MYIVSITLLNTLRTKIFIVVDKAAKEAAQNEGRWSWRQVDGGRWEINSGKSSDSVVNNDDSLMRKSLRKGNASAQDFTHLLPTQ